MKYLEFNPTTSGEKLFQFIVREIVGINGISEINKLQMLQFGMRADQMSEYLYGVFCMNILARVIKKSFRLSADLENDSLLHDYLIRYFQENLGIPREPGSRLLDKFASLVFQAQADSGKKISNSTKRDVHLGAATCNCYICGSTVFVKSGNSDVKIQYEHLWPSSYGGNSISDNLLPSCKWCNNTKADMLLWQNSHLHSFVLKPMPSVDEWKAIQRKERVAKHRKYIFDIACEKQITLQEAAIEVGPVKLNSMTADDEDDAIDFFNFSFVSA